MGIPVVPATKVFLKPAVDLVVSERYLSLRMKLLIHSWLFWFALLWLIDFMLATSNDNAVVRKLKNKAVKPPQKCLLSADSISENQKKRPFPDDDDDIVSNSKKQRSKKNVNTITISLRNDRIRIFLSSVEKDKNEFKFSYNNRIDYVCKEVKSTKTTSIFSNDLRDFLDALIFINFFKSFAYLFGNGKQWQLCLDVFKEFFEAIQSVNITKYLSCFAFSDSFFYDRSLKYSFISMTILLLCNQIVNRSYPIIPECLISFFKLILNDSDLPSILKGIIKIFVTSQSKLPDSCPKPNVEDHLKKISGLETFDSSNEIYYQYHMKLSNYFNLPALGILIQIMISIRNDTVSASGITNASQSNILKNSFYESIQKFLKTFSQNELIRKNLLIVYQMEFKEMITKILSETNPGNSSETSSSSFSTIDPKTLFQPLEALIDLLGHIIMKSSVDLFQDEIITITERFVTLIEKLYSEHPNICDTLLKCLRELKKLFLRFFLSYLGNLYKKVNIDKVSNSNELFNDSSETLRKIEFIKRINSTLELLKNESVLNSMVSNLFYHNDSNISKSNATCDGIPELPELNGMDFLNEFCPPDNSMDNTCGLNEFEDFTNSEMQTIHTEPKAKSSIVPDAHNSFNQINMETFINNELKESRVFSRKKVDKILKLTQDNFNRLNIDINVNDIFAEMKAISNDPIADLVISINNIDSMFNYIRTGKHIDINRVCFNFNVFLQETLFQKRRKESLDIPNDESIHPTKTDNIPMTESELSDYFNSLLLRIASYNIRSAYSTEDLSEEYQSILQSLKEIATDEEESTMLFTLMKDFMNIQAHLILIK